MMLQCKSDAISGKTLNSEQARFLMDVKDEYLSLLASSADEITREIFIFYIHNLACSEFKVLPDMASDLHCSIIVCTFNN